MRRTLLILSALLCSGAPCGIGSKEPASPYAAVRHELANSSVPVLLPLPFPPAVGTIRSIAVIDAGPDGYYVGFSPAAQCGGALSCAFFHVAGSPAGRAKTSVSGRDRRVPLGDGAFGIFHPGDCSGASCTEASLTFRRANAAYELDAKVVADPLTVLRAAYRNLRRIR